MALFAAAPVQLPPLAIGLVLAGIGLRFVTSQRHPAQIHQPCLTALGQEGRSWQYQGRLGRVGTWTYAQMAPSPSLPLGQGSSSCSPGCNRDAGGGISGAG
jgi:hypothetical protein